MYRNIELWTRVRARVLEDGESKTAVSKAEGICTETVRRMLLYKRPPKYTPKKPREARCFGTQTAAFNALITENDARPENARLNSEQIFRILSEDGYKGTSGAVRYHMHRHEDADELRLWKLVQKVVRSVSDDNGVAFLASLFPKGTLVNQTAAAKRRRNKIHAEVVMVSQLFWAHAEWVTWLSEIERTGNWNSKALERQDIKYLVRKLVRDNVKDRKKALVILARAQGFSGRHIASFLNISISATQRYIQEFQTGGVDLLFSTRVIAKKEDNEELKKMVFSLLHEPPSLSGLNRTTWRMADLETVLKEKGFFAGYKVLYKIIRAAGYRWRSARVVLTSNDPTYKEKVAQIHKILSGLKDDERFFSIDEFGPFSVKMKGGRLLVPPDVHPTVPQLQRSKGYLILTAALELSHNQVTHFFSVSKNTEEMIKLAKVLIQEYHTAHKLYLSWDAASWHSSLKLASFLDKHNAVATAQRLPLVEVVALPANAQFLNIIESVFSGMARAILHNSNYESTDAAMHAIDLYFTERNQHYIDYPKPAGKKIWGLERTSTQFAAENNCKNPKYR